MVNYCTRPQINFSKKMGVIDTGDKTVLLISACLHLKMENKPKLIYKCKVLLTKILKKCDNVKLQIFLFYYRCC
jgi:hypothetical protein